MFDFIIHNNFCVFFWAVYGYLRMITVLTDIVVVLKWLGIHLVIVCCLQ